MRDAELLFAGSTQSTGKPLRRPGRRTAVYGSLALLALAAILFGAAPAHAAYVHKPAGTFQLQTLFEGQPGPIAVDDQTGDVYVMRGSCCESWGSIEKFDSEGNKSNFSSLGTNVLHTGCEGGCYQIAVDNSGGPNQGVIYVSSSESMTTCCPTRPNPTGGIHVYLPSGAAVGTKFSGQPVNAIYTRSQSELAVHACGVAVDEDGNLIVAHGEGNTEYSYIDKIGVEPWATHPEQEPPVLGTLNSDTVNPCKTQVDSAGNVYTEIGSGFGGGELKYSSGAIRRYAPSFHEPVGVGAIPPSLRDRSTSAHEGPDRGFAFDSEDNLYGVRISGPARVQKVDQSGSLIETIGSGEFFEPMDIAVDKATGTVYVTDGSYESGAKDVHIFKAFKVPDSTTGLFTASSQTAGSLNGEVDPIGAGEVTGCEFEYTTETHFLAEEFTGATAVECEPSPPLSGAEEVSAPVSGLTLEEPYYYRLKSENANGASNGTVRKFVPHAVVNLTTNPASEVAPRSATLNASFKGNGDATEYFFEYGHSLPGVYVTSTATQSAGSPGGQTELSMPITGLELETTYHFRVVAVNGTGTSKGFDEAFTTPPAVSNLVTEPATEIGQDGVTLNAKFSGDNLDTHYFFEYGPTASYGLTSEEEPGADAGTTTGSTPISSQISSYYGYTTYHYRVVASNPLGTSYGKDLTFTTEPAPLPAIANSSVSDITPTGATFSASVAPNRWDAGWLFEWGETTSYDSLTELEEVVIGLDTSFHPVTATIEGLKPATIYHYRAVTFNFTGATDGPDQTFITPAVPTVDSFSASDVGLTTAHLRTLVLANSSPTEVHFEFGPSTTYGTSTASSAIGSDSTLVREVSANLTGLAPGTTYHYRVVGVNGFGTNNGQDGTFTTQAAPAPPAPPKESLQCPKGKVKRHGKCVPKHKPKHHKKHKRRDSK